MVYGEISDFFDERQPRYDHSKNDLKYTPSGAILEWFWGGAPAAPREGLGSNSIWLWTYPMGTWSPMIPKQSYQIWPFPARVWGTRKWTLNGVQCATLNSMPVVLGAAHSFVSECSSMFGFLIVATLKAEQHNLQFDGLYTCHKCNKRKAWK